jgi:hypothetical protein
VRSRVRLKPMHMHMHDYQPCTTSPCKWRVSAPRPALQRKRTRLGGTGGGAEVVEEVALGLEELDVGTVVDDLLVGLEGLVVGAVERGESPLLGDDDLLASRELVTGTTEGLDDDGLVLVTASDGHDHLATAQSQRGRFEEVFDLIRLTC